MRLTPGCFDYACASLNMTDNPSVNKVDSSLYTREPMLTLNMTESGNNWLIDELILLSRLL